MRGPLPSAMTTMENATTESSQCGRRAAEHITIADLTGTGVQDTAIANLAAQRATETGAGQTIET